MKSFSALKAGPISLISARSDISDLNLGYDGNIITNTSPGSANAKAKDSNNVLTPLVINGKHFNSR